MSGFFQHLVENSSGNKNQEITIIQGFFSKTQGIFPKNSSFRQNLGFFQVLHAKLEQFLLKLKFVLLKLNDFHPSETEAFFSKLNFSANQLDVLAVTYVEKNPRYV